MRNYLLIGLLFAVVPLSAQITAEQRLFDFQHLANLFAKRYGPYEWKRDKVKTDLYDVSPWLARVRNAKDDMETLEIMSEYVASLEDTHSQFRISSTFSVSIPLAADIYEGKVLIDGLNRAAFPVTQVPIQIGDEVVSLDDKPVAEVIASLAKLQGWANRRARDRNSASYLFFRPQSLFPRAHETGPSLKLEIAHQTGGTAVYTIPWTRTGTPITRIGPVISPRTAAPRRGAETGADPALPVLTRFNTRMLEDDRSRVVGLGARNPYFRLPAGFQVRLGAQAAHFHFSGTYNSGGKRIGYLRIRNFAPPSDSAALNELVPEIAFLQANTDGLVVDITRNTGGGCYGVNFLQMLIPYRFSMPADEVRATLDFINDIEAELQFARAIGAPASEIAQLEQLLRQLRTALDENRGRTGPTPFCGADFEHDPIAARDGSVLAYSKPLIVLTDEFTISFGDTVAAALQDNGRGPVFGFRTNGAGGTVALYPAGFYTESLTTLSLTLGLRQRTIRTDDYGETNVLENTGVRPDIPYDYMTKENLLNAGTPFVEAFTRAILAEIEKAGR